MKETKPISQVIVVNRMNILITGANGYIGQRLIPVLLEDEHRLICCVRNRSRFDEEQSSPLIEAIEADFDDSASVASIVSDPFSSASIEKEALHLLDTIRSNARTNEDSHGSKILLAGYGFGGIVVKQVHYRQGLPNKLPNLLSDCLLRP